MKTRENAKKVMFPRGNVGGNQKLLEIENEIVREVALGG